MRLIDADALKKQVIECDLEKPEKITFRWMISQQPTIDAVPVVRCKDCKHKGHDSWCDYVEDENFFCARGERKDGDGNAE